jgi:hypothetical protein
MFQINQRTGRLVEARVSALVNVGRVDAYAEAFGPVLQRIPRRPILCADHRPVAIYSQPVADRLTELFTGLNKTWERVAILVAPTNATLAMQLQRIVRESGNPSRRVFFDPAEAAHFLSEILDPAEQARLRAFLDVG